MEAQLWLQLQLQAADCRSVNQVTRDVRGQESGLVTLEAFGRRLAQ